MATTACGARLARLAAVARTAAYGIGVVTPSDFRIVSHVNERRNGDWVNYTQTILHG